MEERGAEGEDKTEEATEERRKQFREEGNVANPREIVSALSLGVFFAFFSFAGKAVFFQLAGTIERTARFVSESNPHKLELQQAVVAIGGPLLPGIAAIGIAAMVVPALAGLAITRFNVAFKRLEFKVEKFNPVSGLQRMLGTQGLVELGKSLLKLAVLSCVLGLALQRTFGGSTMLSHRGLRGGMADLGLLILDLLLWMAVASFALGAVDFGISWFQLQQKMKMSKKEIKDETKSQEGDPHVKGARRRMARDFVMRQSLAQIPKATFVVTNPTHYAVAIRYVKGMNAPVVVAKGQDFLALRIREIAKKHDIILVENKALARTLYKSVKPGQEVPAALYASVIEVMKYIYQVRGSRYFDTAKQAS